MLTDVATYVDVGLRDAVVLELTSNSLTVVTALCVHECNKPDGRAVDVRHLWDLALCLSGVVFVVLGPHFFKWS
jgi:hypothetical protein